MKVLSSPSSGDGANVSCDNSILPCPKPEKLPKMTIRASLFFDGTGNNKTNSRMRRENLQSDKKNKIPFLKLLRESFESDFTNVSKLHDFILPDSTVTHSFSIYIEGVGTIDGEADNLIDIGFGVGLGGAQKIKVVSETGDEERIGTGVKDKVSKSLDLLAARIGQLEGSKQIEYIYLDLFGFSRGAAAARNFIHTALNEPNQCLRDRLARLGYSVNSIEVIFVGLFDTVAAYGMNYSNDTADLNLDAIRNAKRVVQLAAAEEYRENFILTAINSALNGTQIFLPGAHADIGGGYVAKGEEKRLSLYELSGIDPPHAEVLLDHDRNWFVRAGWYNEAELTTVDNSTEGSYDFKIIANRKNISNEYSRIPLHLMADFAAEQGLNFSPYLYQENPIPDELSEIKSSLDNYVAGPGISGESQPSDWYDNNSEMMRYLRHNYLHFSAQYGSYYSAYYGYGMKPRFEKNGEFLIRKREIHDDA